MKAKQKINKKPKLKTDEQNKIRQFIWRLQLQYQQALVALSTII